MSTTPQPETHAMSSEDAAYIKERLEIMDAQDRAFMESYLKVNPTLTPESYMEMVVAFGG